jgi:hypothetical protein
MATVQDLINVLASRAKFEPVEVDEKPTQIRMLGRVRTDAHASAMDNWLAMMNAIAEREEHEGCTWKVDISRKYFRRNGRLIFAWRLIIQGENLEASLPELVAAAQSTAAVAKSYRELDEIPLPGVRGDRNAHINGKGAGATGKVLTGPMAVQAALRGGG